MKNVKKTAMTGLAAVLATSAVVPAAVASAENTATTALKEVVLQLTDGSKVQVDYDAYKAAKTAEIEWAETAKVIGTVGSDKVTYDIKDFIEAKTAAEGDLAETLELLTNNKKPAELNDVKPGEVKDGELVIKDETPSKLAVDSVKAINATSVEVTFNQAVEAIDKADVTVLNKKTSEKQYVKEVKLAEDKKSATVTFYDALTDKSTYNVAVKDAGNADFDFVVGAVSKIEAETTQVGKADPIVKYKVLDANGLDITSETTVKYESNKTINQSTGKLTLAAGESAFVYVIAVDKDGKELAKSERITVKAEASKVANLLAYTVDGSDFTLDDFEAKHAVRKGDNAKSLTLYVEDQFGDKSTLSTSGVTYESLNKEVALVDRTTGKITTLKTGTVAVRVTVGDFSKIIELTVEETAQVDSLSLDKTEINLSDKLTDGQTVKVTVKDQYGDAVKTSGKAIKAEVKEGKDLITVDASKNTDSNGVADFAVKPVKDKEGKAVVEFTREETVEGKTVTYTTTLIVNVTKAGAVDNYVVEGFEKELDKYAGKDGKNITSMDLSVFGVDANGTKTGAASDVEISLLDKNGDEVTTQDALNNAKIDGAKLTADETYKVVVKVGTLTVFQDTFTVKDTTPEAVKPVASQIASNIKAESLDITPQLADAFEITFDGTVQDEAVIKEFTFNSDNGSVVANGVAASEVKINSVGNATLVFDTIKVDLDGDDSTTEDVYTIDVDAQINVAATLSDLADKFSYEKLASHAAVDVISAKDLAAATSKEDGAITITTPFANLTTHDSEESPSEAKWLGVKFFSPANTDVKAQLIVKDAAGKVIRNVETDATNQELGEKGFFWFFGAQEAGNEYNVTVAWKNAEGNLIKVETATVNYVNGSAE